MSKVLHIIPYPIFPPMGGAWRPFFFLREIARCHEVHAIIFQPLADMRGCRNGYSVPPNVHFYGPAQTPPPRTVFHLLPRRMGRALHYRWLRRSWKGPAHGTLLDIHHLIADIVTRQAIDLVIFEHLDSLMASPIVRRLSPRTIQVLHNHNVESDLQRQILDAAPKDQINVKGWQNYRIMRQIESNLHRQVDAFWVCSELDRERLEELNCGRVRGYAIPTGVDTAVLRFDPNPDKASSKTVLFCGTLNTPANRNGLAWFKQHVWPLIAKSDPLVRFTIVGMGAGANDFMELRSDPRVSFVGEVETVTPYYQQAAVAVVPLLQGGGTRVKIVEAMALGTPVVSTTIGAEGIHLENGEHIMVCDAPEQFAVAVLRLLSSREFYHRMRTKARKWMEEHYDWRVIGRDVNRNIELLVSGSRLS